MKLVYRKLNKDNILDAVRVQYEVFPDSCAYSMYEKEANDTLNNWFVTYIAYLDDKPIGIIGLYEIPKYKNVAWLSWFGLKKQYRKKGYGNKMFKYIEKEAKSKGMTELRLFTFRLGNKEAQYFYRKTMDLEEGYYNELESDKYNIWEYEPKIFSKSLNNKKILPWNNKFIDITSDEEIHKNSLKLLEKNNII